MTSIIKQATANSPEQLIIPTSVDHIKKTSVLIFHGIDVTVKLGLVRAAHALKEINIGRKAEDRVGYLKLLMEVMGTFDMPMEEASIILHWAMEKSYFKRKQERLTRDMILAEFDRLDDEGTEEATAKFNEMMCTAFYALMTTCPDMMRQLDPLINPVKEESDIPLPLKKDSNED